MSPQNNATEETIILKDLGLPNGLNDTQKEALKHFKIYMKVHGLTISVKFVFLNSLFRRLKLKVKRIRLSLMMQH